MDTLRLEFFDPYGVSVYVTRLHTKAYEGPPAPAALAAVGPVRLTETDQNVTVQTAGTQLILDKHTGQIISWRANDQDVVIGGPVLNLGDSPAAGRRGGGGGGGGGRRGGPTFVNTSQAPQYRNVAVTAKMDGSIAKIAVTADVYLAATNESSALLTYTFAIGPDAQADLTWNLAWKAADVSAREAGLKFLLPANTDRMSWFRDSVWTEYPAGHVDGPQGSVTSKDTTFNSVKRDVHWVSLSGTGNYGVVALATSQLLHLHNRVENNGLTLYLSSAIASTGDTPGDDIRLTQATPIVGGLRLRVAANGK
jgi:hypothetical protein